MNTCDLLCSPLLVSKPTEVSLLFYFVLYSSTSSSSSSSACYYPTLSSPPRTHLYLHHSGTSTALGLAALVPNSPMVTTFVLSCWVGNSCVAGVIHACPTSVYRIAFPSHFHILLTPPPLPRLPPPPWY